MTSVIFIENPNYMDSVLAELKSLIPTHRTLSIQSSDLTDNERALINQALIIVLVRPSSNLVQSFIADELLSKPTFLFTDQEDMELMDSLVNLDSFVAGFFESEYDQLTSAVLERLYQEEDRHFFNSNMV